jgi:hypothetical protein
MPVLYEPDAPEDSFELTPDCNQQLVLSSSRFSATPHEGQWQVCSKVPPSVLRAGPTASITTARPTRCAPRRRDLRRRPQMPCGTAVVKYQ